MESTSPGKTFGFIKSPEMDEATDKMWTEGMVRFLKGNPFHHPISNSSSGLSMLMHGFFTMVDLYEEFIQDNLDEIKELNSENKVFQEIREKHQDNLEIVEICREILFLHAKQIQFLTERIEDAKSIIKGFVEKRRAPEEPS